MISEQEWQDRFHREIGKLIFNSPTVSLLMRHNGPIDTLRDYFDVPRATPDTPEGSGRQFVKEFAQLCSSYTRGRGAALKSFAQRWTGLDDPTADLARRLSEDLDEQIAAIGKKESS